MNVLTTTIAIFYHFIHSSYIHFLLLQALPMLPRQREETFQLVREGKISTFWGRFGLCSLVLALIYSSFVVWTTVLDPQLACLHILGGTGCSVDDDTGINIKVDYIISIILMVGILLYCYGIIWIFTFRIIGFKWSNYYWLPMICVLHLSNIPFWGSRDTKLVIARINFQSANWDYYCKQQTDLVAYLRRSIP